MPDKGKKETKQVSKTVERGRDAKTGHFIPVDRAKSRPSTTTVERVPKPGYGDTGRSGKKK